MNPKYRQKKTCVSRIISITAVKTFVGTLIGLGLAAVSVPAFAQLEEIIVTAQKREQSMQELGLTVAVFDEKALKELQGDDLFAIGDQLPNVQIYTSANLPSFTIRGIGLNEFQASFDSPVGVHIDEVYMSKPFMVSTPFYDIQRVEVLKGPQGTLFGRNTTGGAVNYYSNLPTDEFEASIYFSADSNERRQLEGHISGPISDNLLGRFSVYSATGSGGPYFNIFTGDDIGSPDVLAFRGQLLWEGVGGTRVRLLVHGASDESELTPYKSPGIFNPGGSLFNGDFCDELFTGEVIKDRTACLKFGGVTGDPNLEKSPQDPFTVNQEQFPTANNDSIGGFLRIDHEFGGATVTSITALEKFERDQREDGLDSPLAVAQIDWYNDIEQFSQEIRIAGDVSDGRWRYVVGFFYEKDDFEEVDSLDFTENPVPFLPPFAPWLGDEFKIKLESLALFVHNEFDITDKFTINLGLRGTQDETTLVSADTFLGADPVGKEDRLTQVIPVDSRRNEKRTDKDFSFRLGGELTPKDNVMIYANLTTGFKSGGFAIPFGGLITSYDPETIFAQELGIKTRLLNETLQVNGSVFRHKYKDVQANVDDPASPITPITRNIGDTEAFGLEADLWWAPNDQWDVKFGVGYLNAEIVKSDRSITTYAGPELLQGNTPMNSPKWNFSGLLRYQRPLNDQLELILMTDFSWTDERYLETTNQPFDLAYSYELVNVRAAVASANGNWELALWGKNITDTAYLTYINNLSFFKLDIYNEQGATYGLSLTYNIN